ncbi:Crp/Fnr family transcriptional regulator [Thiocapsa marina]|uniref:Putative transcriptional regulator, Crp/Fnr family n=1 Tax=Thiocapsa marina 5811 TaxID=768671 RepID=F9U9J0_9GAMM|nr:Crp/Fnr family transcriptional regulator [Thiocapsa marina]EGV19448.1 putative transcriptional regulator, Crp/Fnr family [Thiocapsa marina 5811]
MQPEKNSALSDNRLLASLPDEDHRQVLKRCESVELARDEVINEPGEQIRHVYFPTDCYFSLVTRPIDHAGLEVRLVGREGMVGTPLVLGIDVTLLRTVVRGAGPTWRMTAERFPEALRKSTALQLTLNRYLFVVTNQVEQMVACTRFHVLEARLARWLLMTQDRAHSDHFHATHEFLALLLGVRRVGVTKAATALQKRNLIHYSRGDIRVLDRPGLQTAACACYGESEAMYEQFMG